MKPDTSNPYSREIQHDIDEFNKRQIKRTKQMKLAVFLSLLILILLFIAKIAIPCI